jgi:hypothetical protein
MEYLATSPAALSSWLCYSDCFCAVHHPQAPLCVIPCPRSWLPQCLHPRLREATVVRGNNNCRWDLLPQFHQSMLFQAPHRPSTKPPSVVLPRPSHAQHAQSPVSLILETTRSTKGGCIADMRDNATCRRVVSCPAAVIASHSNRAVHRAQTETRRRGSTCRKLEKASG